jgi:hypothetical protein
MISSLLYFILIPILSVISLVENFIMQMTCHYTRYACGVAAHYAYLGMKKVSKEKDVGGSNGLFFEHLRS